MSTHGLTTVQEYEFEGGFPSPETIQRAYDDADLVRAITAYRFFYPSVSAMCVYDGNIDSGMVANRVSCLVRDPVGMSGLTMNSDTPYVGWCSTSRRGRRDRTAAGAVDGRGQRSAPAVGDGHRPAGPDHGQGGKHLLLGPGHTEEVPAGYYAATPTTNRVLGLIRALPPHGDLDAGIELMKSVQVYPLDGPGTPEVEWVELSLLLDYSPGHSRPRCGTGRCCMT